MYLGLPYLFFTNRRRFINSTAVIIAVLLSIFVIAVIASDLINRNYFEFFIRGLARPVALGLNAFFFTLIILRSPRLLLYFLYGMVPGACLGYFQASQYFDLGVSGDYKHFNAKVEPILRSGSVLCGVFLMRFHRLLPALFMFIPGVLVMVLGSRSGSIAYFMTAATLFYIWCLKGSARGRLQLNARFICSTFAVLLVGLSFAYFAYIYAAPSGIIGERQQEKFYDQSSTRFGVSPLGLIASGRAEVVAGVLAALDNPILGLGSWPNIGEYLTEAVDISGEEISEQQYQYFFTQRAAGHSIIIGTWFNNGTFALVFWLYFVLCMLRVLLFVIRRDNLLSPFVIYLCYELSWALLFSPLNLYGRLWVGLFAAMAICFTDKRGPLVSEEEFAMLSPFSKQFKRTGISRLQ